MIPLFLLLQAGLPTVGDTVWLSVVVPLPPGRVVRAPDWQSTGVIEPLGRPIVIANADSVRVRYPVVVWEPGEHRVDLPGPLLISPDGRVDSLPGRSFTISVASVLPEAPDDSMIAPQPQANTVPRPTVTSLPLVVLWAVLGLVLIPAQLLWQRRGRPGERAPLAGRSAAPPIARWVEAGEFRAAAAAVAAGLRSALAGREPEAAPPLSTEDCLAVIARLHPDWPVAEIGAVLRSLDDTRFTPGRHPDVVDLSRRAEALARAIEQAA